VETVCCVTLQTFFDDKKVETEVRKWPRQQPKGFYAAGFDALVKRWDKCISVGGGYVEKDVFSRFEYHMFYVLYPFVTYFLTLPRHTNVDDVTMSLQSAVQIYKFP
jgi:hypothetical protein